MDNTRPSLEIVDGELKGARFALLADDIVIGSDPDSDVCLGNLPGISRRHARLFRDSAGGWTVEDLDSRNGTKIDGERVKTAALPPEKPFVVGRLTLRLAGAPAAPPSPARAVLEFQRNPAGGFGDAGSAGVAVAGGEAAGLAPAGGGQLPGTPADVEAILGNLGAGAARSVSTVAILGALVLLALYGASFLRLSAPAAVPYTRIVPVGHDKALFTWKNYANTAQVGQPAGGGQYLRLRDYDGLMRRGMDAAYQRMENRGYPTLKFIVAQGLARTRGGEAATVRLLDRAGATLEEIPVIVVGGDRRPLHDDANDEAARQDMLNGLIMEGDLFAREGRRHLAIASFERAEALALRLNRNADSEACARKAARMRAELSRELSDLFERAIEAAYPDRAAGLTRRNLVEAHRLFDRIKQLVPDESSPDWQVADSWQSLLRHMAGVR